MSLRTPREWQQHSDTNMTHAVDSQLKAHNQCDNSKSAHRDCLSANLTAYGELHSQLDEKVLASQRLVEKLENRARSVEQSIDKTKHSLAQVEAAHRAKEAPLNLCTWRIDQRERRPMRELVRDNVELSLEEERATLLESQRKLNDAAKRSKGMIAQLQDTLQELNHDINDKRQALTVDDMCLRTTHRVWQAQVDRPGGFTGGARPGSARLRGAGGLSTSVPATQRQVHHEDSSRNESARQGAAHRHSHAAANKEQESKELREENQRLIDRCEQVCNQAANKSERALQDRIAENQNMRRNLENEVRETNNKIDHTKQTISETHAQIKSLEEPMALVSTRDSWRKQRALREQIKDPVSTHMEDQKLCLIHTNETLRQHRIEEKGALNTLQQNKERLKEDLRDKTQALHIDLNCLSHEAMSWSGKTARHVSKHKLSKALKVDPTFTPAGGSIGSYTPMRSPMRSPMSAR